MAPSTWTPSLSRETSALWSNSHSSHSMAIETPVESDEGEILKTDSTRPSVPPGHPRVANRDNLRRGVPIRACQNRKRRDRPDSSRLAQPGGVSGPIRSRDRLSNNSPASAETAQADLLTPLSSASVESQPSCYRGYQGIPQGERIF